MGLGDLFQELVQITFDRRSASVLYVGTDEAIRVYASLMGRYDSRIRELVGELNEREASYGPVLTGDDSLGPNPRTHSGGVEHLSNI